jgi:putative oxidoreductase
MTHDPQWITLMARFFLVLMFPFSAVDKMIHRDEALMQANTSILPGGSVLLVLAMVIELAAPVCIVFDWHARPAALLLSVFCIATALLYHPFWCRGDFWSPGSSVDRAHFWDFTKNFGLAGGLLLVALGAGLPLASSI